MAGWTNLTPSAAALAAGNAYLYEDAGALKYQGTSGSAATVVNADGTLPGGGSGWTLITSSAMSGASTINFSGITQTYRDLKVFIDGATVGTSSKAWLRMGNGSAATSNSYNLVTSQTTSATWTASAVVNAIELGPNTFAARYVTFEIKNYTQAVAHPVSCDFSSGGSVYFGVASFAPGPSVSVDYVSIQNSGAYNWTGGTVYLYGRS